MRWRPISSRGFATTLMAAAGALTYYAAPRAVLHLQDAEESHCLPGVRTESWEELRAQLQNTKPGKMHVSLSKAGAVSFSYELDSSSDVLLCSIKGIDPAAPAFDSLLSGAIQTISAVSPRLHWDPFVWNGRLAFTAPRDASAHRATQIIELSRRSGICAMTLQASGAEPGAPEALVLPIELLPLYMTNAETGKTEPLGKGPSIDRMQWDDYVVMSAEGHKRPQEYTLKSGERVVATGSLEEVSIKAAASIADEETLWISPSKELEWGPFLEAIELIKEANTAGEGDFDVLPWLPITE